MTTNELNKKKMIIIPWKKTVFQRKNDIAQFSAN